MLGGEGDGGGGGQMAWTVDSIREILEVSGREAEKERERERDGGWERRIERRRRM